MKRRASTTKLSITLPRELVEEIKGIGPAGGMSGFLARAAQQYLAHERFMNAIETGYGAWKEQDHPDLLTSEDATIFVRRLRGGGIRTSGIGGENAG